MAFKVAFIAHAPDAEPDRHKCLIETPKYKLFVQLVRDQSQAVKACLELVKKEGISSILLCPGFSHKDIAELAEAVGPNVGICVARGDPPSNRVAEEVMKKEGWFSEKGGN